MAFQRLVVSGGWPGRPQFTAAAETAIELINPNSYAQVKWITTLDDAVPNLPPTDGSPLRPGDARAVTLLEGERLWLVAPGLRNSILITLQN